MAKKKKKTVTDEASKLIRAVKFGYLKQCKQLLSDGVNVDFQDEEGMTALMTLLTKEDLNY